MQIHRLSTEKALHSLHSSAEGLDSATARRRLREFGPNQISALAAEPLLSRFLKGFTHFFAIILWIAALLAFFADWQSPGQGMATLGFAILGVILVNGLFSFWQEYRAEQTLASLQKLLPHQVKTLRDGEVTSLQAARLVPGDVVLLQEGDEVPADCRVISAFGLRVNNATVTGESLPQPRDAQADERDDLLHSRNVLLAGTVVVSGEGRALVFATGMRSTFGQIARLSQSSGVEHSPLQQEIIRMSRLIAILASLMGVIFFFIGQSIGLSFWENFIFAIGIIVANVPEGLLPTVTLALAMSSRRMAQKQVLIRHLPAVETLGCTTVICTDKTGTLTQNRMSVKQCYLNNGFQPRPHTNQGMMLLHGAALCHTLNHTAQGWLGDPMEIALLEMAETALSTLPNQPMRDQIPFDADRKRLSTLHQTPTGLMLHCKGALETLLPLCQSIEIDGQTLALTDALRAQILQAQQDMASQGLRVLAFAYRALSEDSPHDQWEQQLTLTGLIGLEDPPRPEVPAAIGKCREAGIRIIMITGDNPSTALAIGREIGLFQSEAPSMISGEQLAHMSDTELQLALDAPEVGFARVAADQKMRIVIALKSKGDIVAVTGDGVNDAPALKQADIGVAMGLGGTDVAKAAADMILLDDNFASIVAAIEEGRAVYENIRKFLTYILSSNIPEVVPYLAFALLRIPLPLTVIQILMVDLGSDMLPALGLGVEKPEAGIMRKAPRPRSERLLTWPLFARAYLFLGLMEAAAAMGLYFYVLDSGGWQYGQPLSANNPLYLQATTACLSAIIIMQVINVQLCRSSRESIFSLPLFNNKWIVFGIITEIMLILLINYSSIGNQILAAAPIPASAWLLLIPFAAAMLLLEEMRKWVQRRRTVEGNS